MTSVTALRFSPDLGNRLSYPIVSMDTMKTAQLTLIADEQPWHLDEGTRRIGREGLAKAREALAAHTDRRDDHELAA